jgi:serine/threonine protein kinase
MDNPKDLSNNEIIIGKKYKIIKEIGEGSFGKIFKSLNIFTNEFVAIKIEKKREKSLLKLETNIYNKLKNMNGVPQLRYFGVENDFNYMVIDLLDISIEDMIEKYKKLDIKTTLKIAIESISILEDLHNKFIIHRDIKPENLMIGNGFKRDKIHLIDFGLSRYYVDENNSHKPINYNKKLTGTAKYASLNVLEGIEPSRRDDLISLGYILIYCMKGSLPWQHIDEENKEIKYLKIKELKTISLVDLCKDLPYEFLSYMDYCSNLKYEETPNYNYIKTIFTNLFQLHKSNK